MQSQGLLQGGRGRWNEMMQWNGGGIDEKDQMREEEEEPQRQIQKHRRHAMLKSKKPWQTTVFTVLFYHFDIYV